MPTLHLMHHWFRSLLIQFDEKRHNGGSDDHDGVDKKGPFMGDTNISPISEARSNSVYLLVLSQVWRDTGTWLFTICFPTFFLSCPHKGNICQLCNLLKMTAGPGLPVCQGTPLRTHGQLFPVFSKSTIILRLNHFRGIKARHVAAQLLLGTHRIKEKNSKIKSQWISVSKHIRLPLLVKVAALIISLLKIY